MFNTYNKKSSTLVCIVDHNKLKILEKGMVLLDVLIDGKLQVVNFCNIVHFLEFNYNLLLVGIIEKVRYSIYLAKNKKMVVYNNKDNIVFQDIKIGTSYLMNVFVSKKTLILVFLYFVPHKSVSWTQ